MGSVEPLLIDLSLDGPRAASPAAAPPAAPPTAPPVAPPAAPPPAAPEVAGSDESQLSAGVDELCSMFPDADRGVVEAVLQASGSVEQACEHLLEMTSGTSEGGGAMAAAAADEQAAAAAQVDADEELAMALFKELAEEMDERVPEAVRSDPEQYDVFVRQQMERELTRKQSEGQLGKQASELLTKIKDGSTNFFKQLGQRRQSGGNRIDPNSFTSPLLLSGDSAASSSNFSTSTRGPSNSAYAPPSVVISPLTSQPRPS